MLKISLACLLAAGLAAAVPSFDLVKRAPPASGNNVCQANQTYDQYPYCNYGTYTFAKGAAPISKTVVGSLKDCRDACLVNPACHGFGYKASGTTCFQYRKPIDAQKPGKKNQKAPIHYWGRKCFSATYYNTRALFNTGFESRSLTPWKIEIDPTDGNGNVQIAGSGDGSSFSAEYSVDNTAGVQGDPDIQVFLTQSTSSLCPGVGYGFHFSLFQESAVTSGACHGNIHFFLYDPNGADVYDKALGLFEGYSDDAGNQLPEGNWYSAQINFQPTVAGHYTVRVQVESCAGGAATMRIDDVAIQAL